MGSRNAFLVRATIMRLTMVLVCTPAALPAQGDASLLGHVVESGGREPVAFAEVRIESLGIETRTNEAGWFVVSALPLGEHLIEIRRIGYRPVSELVRFRSGETLILELQVIRDPVALRGVGVEGMGKEGESGSYAIGRLDLTRDGPAGASMHDLLQRIAGVRVVRASGMPGSEVSISIRGATSVAGQPPMIIIDGVVSYVSQLINLEPAEIATIEVLRGAAAAAEFGSRAQAGVIRVATRRGRP